MTEQQVLEINAFLDKEDNITKLAKRGYNGETLTEYELALLENAKGNINEILKIYDLDSELNKRLNKLLLYIINVKQLDKVIQNKEVKSESTLSIAIKDSIKAKENKELTLNSKWYLNKELVLTTNEISLLRNREYDIINDKEKNRDSVVIYNKLGGLNRTMIMLAFMIAYTIMCVVIGKVIGLDTETVIPFFTTVKSLTTMCITLALTLNTVQLVVDLMYIMIPDTRNLFRLGDGDLSRVKMLVSPEARLTPIIKYSIDKI